MLSLAFGVMLILPIDGADMPTVEAARARMVLAIKRGMSPGFAGVENELYFLQKTMMLFGDARTVVGDMASELAGTTAAH